MRIKALINQSPLDLRHVSNLHKQYCIKKAILGKNHITIILVQFFSLKSSIHWYFSWFWKATTIFWLKKIFSYKNIVLSFYLFITILLVKIPRVTRALKFKPFTRRSWRSSSWFFKNFPFLSIMTLETPHPTTSAGCSSEK